MPLWSNMVVHEKWNVLVCDPVDGVLIDGLKDRGLIVEYKPSITPDDLAASIGKFHVVVVRSRTKLTASVLSSASSLKIIARAGIGTDNIDTEYTSRHGISIVTAAGSSTHSVAELNISLLTMLARNLNSLAEKTKNGNWQKSSGTELYGKTAGIIGMGRIGFATASILSAMGMRVIAFDPVVNMEFIEKIHGEYLDLDTILSLSDVIFVLANLTDGGKDMLNALHFSRMKQGVFIVNTSRAEFINGNDLFAALKSGKIGGYAADVFWHEPPVEPWEKELISMNNVIVTPHIGAQTYEAQRKVAEYTLSNLFKKMEEI
ncbi:MAG: NAD(P)-dependent oxidoreductase [Thermoplasmata archaeon]